MTSQRPLQGALMRIDRLHEAGHPQAVILARSLPRASSQGAGRHRPQAHDRWPNHAAHPGSAPNSSKRAMMRSRPP